MRNGLLLAALLAAAAPLHAQDSAAVRLTFLDVGQGDAILVRSPEGKTALIDAGPGSIVRQLRTLGVDTIDIAVASHAHADHIGGMAEVLARFPVRYYMDNGLPYTTATYGRVLRAVQRSNATYLEAKERVIQLGSVTLRVIPPPHIGRPGPPMATPGRLDQNTQSIGLLVEYGQFRALLTGDSEVEELNYFLERGMPQVTVLKAPHHGSRDAVTPAWLQATRPQVVVISVGRGNTYGHPHPWALRYYEAVAQDIYRTDLDGTVTIVGRRDGSYRAGTAR